MTTLVMAGILLFGTIGFRSLPVSDLPNVDFPTIQVTAGLPGASPETMAASVATPLERQFSAIAGLDSINSTSSQGTTQVTLQFALDRNIDAASQDVQTAIAAAARQLPTGMPSPPTLKKVNPADQPVLYLVLSSPTMPLTAVNEVAETLIAQRLSTISGVAQVVVTGAQKSAVRVKLDPSQLAARGIGIDEVATSIQRQNSNLPVGTLYGVHQSLTVKADGQLFDAAAYRTMIVAYRNGSPVTLGDLGKVVDGVENDRIGNWYDDRQVVTLAIQRQPGSNTIAVVDAVKAKLPSLKAQLPGALKLDVLFDRSVPDPRVRARRRVHARPHDRSRRPRHLPVPAQRAGDAHPEPRGAGLDRRDVRGDVAPELLARQPLAHGADALRRLRRGRRDRHAREHRPPHGGRGGPADGRAQGRQGDRLHDPLDDDLARRGLHPGPLHGRPPRPPLQGVRDHDQRRDPRLGVRLADADADALQPLPEGVPRRERGALLQGDGARLRRLARPLRADPRVGSRAPEGDADRLGDPPSRHRRALRRDPEGVPHERRHGPVHRLHGGHAGRVVRRDGAAPEGSRGRHPEPSGRPGRVVDRRRERREPGGQLGKPPRPPQAALGAQAGRRRDHRAAAPEAREGVGDPRLPAEPSVRLDRRPGHAQPVPAHAPGFGPRPAREVHGAAGDEGQGAAGPSRRDDRPPEQEPAARGDDRPRQGVRAGPHRVAGRGRAQQRVRHAPGLDDLHVHERVPGHPRAPRAVPDEPRGPVAPLRAQHRGHARPAVLRRALRRERRPARREPPRAGSVVHDLVQREARRLPGRRDRARARRPRTRSCRSRSRRRSRARRRSSSRPSGASRSSSRSRSS